MKNIVDSRSEKLSFFFYYIFMIIFCAFIAWNSIKTGGAFIPYSIIGGACTFLSSIILYSYFRHIMQVQFLLKAFIFLLLILFIGSVITEFLVFHIKFYPFAMKCSLYGFCIAVPMKQLYELNRKIKAYKKGKS